MECIRTTTSTAMAFFIMHQEIEEKANTMKEKHKDFQDISLKMEESVIDH